MKEVAIRKLNITSSSFNNKEFIPSKYTCDGENINPSLKIDNLPEGTVSLAIIVNDPDSPKGVFTHWVVWNIPPRTFIEENSFAGGVEGLNDFNKNKYMGPCPPNGTHRYVFKVYALDTVLHLEPHASNKEAVEIAVQGHILGYGEILGIYHLQEM